MTPIQAFWHLLFELQHSTTQAWVRDPQEVVRYGGSPLQAFLYALETGWRLIWLDSAS
jgi:hypothetical protein